AQFINLSSGAAMGLLFVRQQNRKRKTTRVVPEARNRYDPVLTLFLGVTIVTGSATIVLSLARVGTVSMLIAGAFVGLLILWRSKSKKRSSVMLSAVVCTLVVLLIVGFDKAFDRLATLSELSADEGGRWEMLQDMVPMFKQFAPFGTGSGTYQFVFPAYEH